jgi:transposase
MKNERPISATALLHCCNGYVRSILPSRSQRPGVINAKNLARLIAETGPLSDFTSWRGLLRYAGLNIRMRQSGIYRGQYRITKKGRPLLRKILSQIVLPLVRRKCLYGEYYHGKRVAMPGQKAMVAVMSHFLRKLHNGTDPEEPSITNAISLTHHRCRDWLPDINLTQVQQPQSLGGYMK